MVDIRDLNTIDQGFILAIFWLRYCKTFLGSGPSSGAQGHLCNSSKSADFFVGGRGSEGWADLGVTLVKAN